MRPLTLRLEGFTAFREPTFIDFTDLDLFAVTGQTGAGKSSIIDAICYALYGATPRTNQSIGAFISLGLERLQVVLEFEANGVRFRVLRESRRRGNGNTRLEQWTGDDWQPLSDRAREVTAMIERIVGLDFEAFIRSALLPQGQFQEFLGGSPENRRDVLRRLLRLEVYERMQSMAGQEAAQLGQRISEIERRLREELADATPENLSTKKRELLDAGAEEGRLATRIEGLAAGITVAHQLHEARQHFETHRAELDSVDQKLAASTAVVESGGKRLDTLRKELAALRESLEGNAYDDEFLASLTMAANLATQIEQRRRESQRNEARLTEATQRAKAATATARAALSAQEEARAALEEAQTILEEARRHDLAATLRAGLKPGDPCPVCGGVIGAVVDTSAAGVEAAQQRLQVARAKDAAATTAAATAGTAAAVAERDAENVKAQASQHTSHVDELTTQLAEALPGMKDVSLRSIQAVLQTQRNLRDERNQQQRRETELARSLSDGERRLETARQEMAAFTAQRDVTLVALEQARERAEAAGCRLAAVIEEHGLGDDGGFAKDADPLPSLQRLASDAQARMAALLTLKGRLGSEIERLERDIATAATLREELGKRKSAHDVAADLDQMLRAPKFPAFIQAEALRSLAEDGTRKLLELSAGRYEFEVAPGGQDFLIKDKWNADDTRSVRTLSGGETFLASLALALALAETLPGLAPGKRLALDSLFLDEGFGSLDPEALALAADALDALRGENRMVCVVTHLTELAQRLPARVIVTKADTGSTVAVG